MGDKDKECCKDKQQESKLVKATEIPIHGNPYPPKDVIIDERPGMLELKIRSIRTMVQPYFSPIATAFERTNDFMAIGVAHSQSAMQRLGENQNTIVKSTLISFAGLLGVGLARRRGIFKKLLLGSAFFGGALFACYPEESRDRALVLWYITKNKLPKLAMQQYEKLTKSGTTKPDEPVQREMEINRSSESQNQK